MRKRQSAWVLQSASSPEYRTRAVEIANLSLDPSMPFPPKSPMDLQEDLSHLFAL